MSCPSTLTHVLSPCRVLCAIAGLVVGNQNVWVGAALILAGGFMVFEAVRGWCVARACGIKTRC